MVLTIFCTYELNSSLENLAFLKTRGNEKFDVLFFFYFFKITDKNTLIQNMSLSALSILN